MNSKSAYLTGIMSLASSIGNLSHSYIEVVCYEKDKVKELFLKDYHIKEKDWQWKKNSNTLKEQLKEWFYMDDDYLLESIDYWIRLRLGENNQVYELTEDSNLRDLLSYSEGGRTGFYTVDDLFLVDFKDFTACFILGNNE